MNDLSTIILKSGLTSMLYEDEDIFKKSLVNCLSFKLNEALREASQTTTSTMLFKEEKTKVTSEIKTLVDFFENYNSKTNFSLPLKNNTSINIQEQNVVKLKELFNSLNSQNREVMAKTLLENANGLKRTLNFYENAKRIIK